MSPRGAIVGTLVAIVAALAMIAFARANRAKDTALHMRVNGDIRLFNTQLADYHSLNGFFPTTEQGLRALVQKPAQPPIPTQWHQFIEYIPPDPWGTQYYYRCPGIKNPNGYDLFSLGPDRFPDSIDDDWGK